MPHPKIHNTGELPAYVNQLIYGPSGAGKTTYLGTAPRLLLIDVEQGTTALAAQGVAVDVWTVTEFEEIWEVYQYLREHPEEYDSVGIDSYTDLCAKCLESVVDEAEERDSRRLTDVAELRDHGRVTIKMAKVLRRFRDLPINLIIICTERQPNERQPKIGPNLPESLTLQAIAYMDQIGYLDIDFEAAEEDGELIPVRKMLFYSPSGSIRVKDRFGVFIPETGRPGLRNITFPKLVQFLKENVQANGQIPKGEVGETPPKKEPTRSRRQPQ